MIPLVIKYIEYHFKTHSALILNDISEIEATHGANVFFQRHGVKTIFCTLVKNPLAFTHWGNLFQTENYDNYRGNEILY